MVDEIELQGFRHPVYLTLLMSDSESRRIAVDIKYHNVFGTKETSTAVDIAIVEDAATNMEKIIREYQGFLIRSHC